MKLIIAWKEDISAFSVMATELDIELHILLMDSPELY